VTSGKLPQGQTDRFALLIDALGDIPLSGAERASLAWLCGFELATVENIAGAIRRARARWAGLASRTARDDARASHHVADLYRAQLTDLCERAGLDPEDVDDPYVALLAYIRGREPGGGR